MVGPGRKKHSSQTYSIWKDYYARRAEKESYPARSVYKLMEIQRRFNPIKKGDRILDLGCFPGSWLLYAANLVGNRGEVIGIDLKPVLIKVPPFVRTSTCDILSGDNELIKLTGNNFNVIMSDMSPDTTGNKRIDTFRSFHLARAALSIAERLLNPGGSFICKIFQGEDFKKFSDSVKTCFTKSRIFKPQSSRKASREIYIIGLDKIGGRYVGS